MRRALRDLQKFWTLPRSDRALLLEAAGVLPLVGLSLRVVRLRSLFAGLGWLAERRTPLARPQDLPGSLRRTRRLCLLAARHGLRPGTCLSRSLTLWWLLRRQGIRSELRIGVRKEADRLDAHAWIECDGVVVNERRDTARRYTPFAETLTR